MTTFLDILSLHGLNQRARNALDRAGLDSAGTLLPVTPFDILDIRNVGLGSLWNIRDAVRSAGLEFTGANWEWLDIDWDPEFLRPCRADGLTSRSIHLLVRAGVQRREDLDRVSAMDLFDRPFVDHGTVSEITRALAAHGMSLAPSGYHEGLDRAEQREHITARWIHNAEQRWASYLDRVDRPYS